MANYTDLVKESFKRKGNELASAGMTAAKESASNMAQSLAAQNKKGAAASALQNKAMRDTQTATNQNLRQLGIAETEAVNQAQMQQDIADQQFWSSIWQGLGSIFSPIVTKGIDKIGETLFPKKAV